MRASNPMRMIETVKTAANAEIQRVGVSCRNLHRAFGSGLSGLCTRRAKDTAVLGIDDQVIKVARVVAGHGDIKVQDLVVKRTPREKAQVPGLIKSVFSGMGLSGDVVAVFPRSKTIVRYVSLPSTDREEIRRMIALQANKIVPFEKGQAVIDFQVVGERPDGFSEVMIVIVDRAAVSEYVNLLAEAGLGVRIVRLDTECTRDFYWSVRHDHGATETENISLLDLDLATTSVNIIRDGRLVFTRSLPFGTMTLFPGRREDPRAVGMFIDQIIDTFASYQKTNKGLTISRIILSGASLNAQTVTDELVEKLSLPVDLLGGVCGDLLSGTASIASDVAIDEISISMVAGAALGSPRTNVDLSPEDLKTERTRRRARSQRFHVAILAVSVVALTSAIVYQRLHRMETYLEEIGRRVEAVRPVAEGIESMRRQTMLVRDQLSARSSLLDPLAELYRLFPEGASLSALNCEESGVVTVKGVAGSMSQVFELVPKLEASAIFESVTVNYVNQRNIRSGMLIDFQISMEAVGHARNTE